MPDSSNQQTRSAPLGEVLLASARNVRDVLAGRSLSDSLAATPAPLRPAAQAISFHAMRHLGLALAVRRRLVSRTPSNPHFHALLLVTLALLETAAAHDDDAAAGVGHNTAQSRGKPQYRPHTVVDQAVKAAGSQPGMCRYKGLLNGTLRRFLREREVILAQARLQPDARYNHPEWWVDVLRTAYPGCWEQLLAAADIPAPMILRANRRRTDVQTLLAMLDEAGITARQAGPAALVLDAARPVQDIPGFEAGLWSVQDIAAQQAGLLLPLADGMRVLDACAAPGGKTAHILEQADVQLTALDADAQRLARVAANLERLGLDGGHVQLRCADAAHIGQWWDGVPYDVVLADVPCTASGVVRRHPDIRWLRRQADIARTAALQRNIVDALWHTVKPGGHLLYATCSLFPQEGEAQAAAFARRHADADRLAAPGQILPLPGSGDVVRDGFFYALFAKTA